MNKTSTNQKAFKNHRKVYFCRAFRPFHKGFGCGTWSASERADKLGGGFFCQITKKEPPIGRKCVSKKQQDSINFLLKRPIYAGLPLKTAYVG
jgi:hypothetical protein